MGRRKREHGERRLGGSRESMRNPEEEEAMGNRDGEDKRWKGLSLSDRDHTDGSGNRRGGIGAVESALDYRGTNRGIRIK